MSYVKSHPLEIQPIISNSTTQSLENPNPKPLIKKRDVHSSPLSWTRLFLDSKITHDSIHPCASGNKTGKKETKKEKEGNKLKRLRSLNEEETAEQRRKTTMTTRANKETRRGCGEKASPASRGANINATPQTADVAPITNLNPLRRASRLARSLNPDLSRKGETEEEEYRVFRLTSPMSHIFLPSSLLSFPSVASSPRQNPLPPPVYVHKSLDAPLEATGDGPPTRHEFSKRHSHFVRLNLERKA